VTATPPIFLADRSGLRLSREVDSRRHDCDTAERMQIEEVFITGHDHVCTPVDGRFEELVVVRITGRANRLQYVDDFDERCGTFEKRIAPFTMHVAIELRRMQFPNQFTQCFAGRNELRVGDSLVDGPRRRRCDRSRSTRSGSRIAKSQG
jgi:hypothetical protein